MMKRLLRNILLLGLAVGCVFPLGRAADTADADKLALDLIANKKAARSPADWQQLTQASADFCARFPTHERYLRVLRLAHEGLCRGLADDPPPNDPVHGRLAAVEAELLHLLENDPVQRCQIRSLHLDFTPPMAKSSSPEGRAKRLRNVEQLDKEFPGNTTTASMLLVLARESPPEWRKKIAQRLLDSATTPEPIKHRAQTLLDNPQELRHEKFMSGVKAARKRLAEHPLEAASYSGLLRWAQVGEPAEGLKIAREIAALANPPGRIHEQAVVLVKQLEKVGRPLKLKGKTTNGEKFDLEKWRGKVVVIDFWAVWCKPCVAEMPALVELYQRKHDQGLEVLGYSLDDSASAPKQFVKANNIPWPVYCDGDGFKADFVVESGITSIPVLWLIDKQGVLRNIYGRDRLEEKIDQLLAE